MRISEILPRYLDGVREVVDVSHPDVKLERQLRLPPEVGYRRQPLDEAVGTDLGPESLPLCLLGADSPVHTDPDALTPMLRRARPGTRAALLIGWSIEELPYHRLVGPLVAGGARSGRSPHWTGPPSEGSPRRWSSSGWSGSPRCAAIWSTPAPRSSRPGPVRARGRNRTAVTRRSWPPCCGWSTSTSSPTW
ncbi:hypothetical protein [Plantactinospora veratri]